jgi:hypothetical protein
LGIGAILTGSHDAELSAEWLSRQGFAPQDLWLLCWERLVTSAVVTAGGATFLRVHLVSLLVVSLLIAWPLQVIGTALGSALVVASDVGPSAGCFGALGLLCARLPRPWLGVSEAGVFLGLVIALLRLPKVGAEAGVAFGAGLAPAIDTPLGSISSGLGQRPQATQHGMEG